MRRLLLVIQGARGARNVQVSRSIYLFLFARIRFPILDKANNKRISTRCTTNSTEKRLLSTQLDPGYTERI